MLRKEGKQAVQSGGSHPGLWLTLAAGLSGREGRLVSRSCSPSPASNVFQFKLSVVSLPSARAPHRQHLSGPFWLCFQFHILDRLRRARHRPLPVLRVQCSSQKSRASPHEAGATAVLFSWRGETQEVESGLLPPHHLPTSREHLFWARVIAVVSELKDPM